MYFMKGALYFIAGVFGLGGLVGLEEVGGLLDSRVPVNISYWFYHPAYIFVTAVIAFLLGRVIPKSR